MQTKIEEKTLFMDNEKADWVPETYPEGSQSLYTAFGPMEESQHCGWRMFVRQGAMLEGQYCIVKSANPKTAI